MGTLVTKRSKFCISLAANGRQFEACWRLLAYLRARQDLHSAPATRGASGASGGERQSKGITLRMALLPIR